MDSVDTKNLTMEPDTGLVWRRVDEDLEPLGFIGDEDAMPDDLAGEWEYLLDVWNDSAEGGHEKSAVFSYYDRLSVARMN